MFNFNIFKKSPYSIMDGNCHTFITKLKQGAFNLNDGATNKYSLLCYAIDHRKPNVTTSLLQYGADPNHFFIMADLKIRPIDLAFSVRYNPSLMKLLVSYGAEYQHLQNEYPKAPVLKWLGEIAKQCYSANGFYKQGIQYFSLQSYEEALSCFVRTTRLFDKIIKNEEMGYQEVPGYEFEQEYLKDYKFRKQKVEEYIKICNCKIGKSNQLSQYI